ncbi:MAG: ribosome-associated heat shock protein Hsp15 [Vibrionaceae bacterium]
MFVKAKNSMPAVSLSIRLDKWLWAARFYKTRAIARDMILGGQVHYNNQRIKPGKIVELGAIVSVRQGAVEKIVRIEKLEEQRCCATHAQTLYQETQQSIAKRELRALERTLLADNPSPKRRPNKKQRRDLINFKNSTD